MIAARAIKNVRNLRIEVSMASGPERPDAARGDRKIAGRHGLRIGRHPRRHAFRAGNAEIMEAGGIVATHHGAVGDAAAGSLELYRSPGLVRATGDEPMSDDPDFPTANHALQVLRQARLSRNEAAAIMLGDLVYEAASTGLRTPEIEEAHQAAWVAISALAKTLKAEGFAPPAVWKAAFGATESWVELLD
jgi:hypothetical protein